MERINKKLVIVGDSKCGKSDLLIAAIKNQFPEFSEVTYGFPYFENNNVNYVDIEVGQEQVRLSIFDTASHEDYDRLRPLLYPSTDVFLMCFSIDSTDSLKNIHEKWIPEVKSSCLDTPVVLVGNKKDLRIDNKTIQELGDRSQEFVHPDKGKMMAKKIKAFEYIECSAKTREGVNEVFVAAARATLKNRDKNRNICSLF